MAIRSVIEERGHVLENAFFARQDELLIRQLRAADEAATQREALKAASGIADTAVLDHWIELGLGPQGLAALALVPLVLVAWADGAIDEREKAALRRAAHDAGVDRAQEAAAMLEAWLAAPPGPEIAKAWREYAHALAAGMAPAARVALERETIGRAHRIAEAAGGFLGLVHRVSNAEARVLAALAEPFRV